MAPHDWKWGLSRTQSTLEGLGLFNHLPPQSMGEVQCAGVHAAQEVRQIDLSDSHSAHSCAETVTTNHSECQHSQLQIFENMSNVWMNCSTIRWMNSLWTFGPSNMIKHSAKMTGVELVEAWETGSQILDATFEAWLNHSWNLPFFFSV